MYDVYISYAHEDKSRVAVLVDELEEEGLSVWWDDRLGVGETWDRRIEYELNQAACVLAIWSKSSIAREWIRVEASRAQQQNKLISVKIDEGVSVPLAFTGRQTAKLTDWYQKPASRSFSQLHDAIVRLIRVRFPRTPVATMFHGAEIRQVTEGQVRGAAIAHATVPPSCVSRPFLYRTTEEIWYFLGGYGAVTRKRGAVESVHDVGPGASIEILLGDTIQFRTTGPEPLSFLVVTTPPWPGGGATEEVAPGKWTAT